MLILAAFGLNWLWEMVQMLVYTEMAGRPKWDNVLYARLRLSAIWR